MKSMTAFARTQTTKAWGRFNWEIRTVNQRYLDLQFKLPENVRHLETAIREQLKFSLARGKIDITLSFEETDQPAQFKVNQAILQPLVNAVNEVQQSLMEATHVNPLEVLHWPGVLQAQPKQSNWVEVLEADLLDGFKHTLAELNQHREREGQALKAILQARCQSIKEHTQQAQTLLPEIIHTHTVKLQQRIHILATELDESRFNQEVALLAQKLDVQEELDRLQTHIIEIEHVLEQTQPVGRRLDFLMQELNREANTLGAKSADSRTSKISIELKVLVEQMREQVQNIE